MNASHPRHHFMMNKEKIVFNPWHTITQNSLKCSIRDGVSISQFISISSALLHSMLRDI